MRLGVGRAAAGDLVDTVAETEGEAAAMRDAVAGILDWLVNA
jgi:hypothetical protein